MVFYRRLGNRVIDAVNRNLETPRPGGKLARYKEYRRAKLERREAKNAPTIPDEPPPPYDVLTRRRRPMGPRPVPLGASGTVYHDLEDYQSPPLPDAEARAREEAAGHSSEQAVAAKMARAWMRRWFRHEKLRIQRAHHDLYCQNIPARFLPQDLRDQLNWGAALITNDVDLNDVSAEYTGPTDFDGNVPIFRKDYGAWLEQLFGWPEDTVQQLYANDGALCGLAMKALRGAMGLAFHHPALSGPKECFDRAWQTTTESYLGWRFEDILVAYHNYEPLVLAAHELMWNFVARREMELVKESASYGINLTVAQARNMDDQTIRDLWARLREWRTQPLPGYRHSNTSSRSGAPSYRRGEWSPAQSGSRCSGSGSIRSPRSRASALSYPFS